MVPVICSQLQQSTELSLLPPCLALSCQNVTPPCSAGPHGTSYHSSNAEPHGHQNIDQGLVRAKVLSSSGDFWSYAQQREENHIVCFFRIGYDLFVKCLPWARGFVSRWHYGGGNCRSDTSQRKSVSGGGTPTSYPCLPSVFLRCFLFH